MMIGSSGQRRMYTYICVLFLGVAGSSWSHAAMADGWQADSSRKPRIALIIDDLGNVLHTGKRAVALNGPVACAVLPHTPYASIIAQQAHGAGKEVLLHLPMQPVEEFELAGLGTIQIDTTRTQLIKIFEADLASIPHVDGISSHMGSLLTQHPGHMLWLMYAVKTKGDLFFVDSYTSASSIAMQMAREQGVPSIRRDVFLDNVPTRRAIDKEFKRLKTLAKQHGTAVGIGHPHEVTFRYLENAFPELVEEGIELVAVGNLLEPDGAWILNPMLSKPANGYESGAYPAH